MNDDLARLQDAEEKLLEGMCLVETVLTGLASGDTQELGRLCESFVHRITESQSQVLKIADKHQQGLPYQNSSYAAQLDLQAAQSEAELASQPAHRKG